MSDDESGGAVSEAKLERIQEANKRKAREQMARDSKEHKREEFAMLEELYQKGHIFEEIRKDHATATSHNGKLIVEAIPQ